MRRPRRDPASFNPRAVAAFRHAEDLEQSRGRSDPETLEAYDVAADAIEEAGNPGFANHIRMAKIMAVTGRGYKYGISPPHGIFVKGTSMAYVKEMSRRIGSPFFDRATTRFFAPEKQYGPYVGPGGVFFVTQNRSGISLREVATDWSIDTIGRVDAGLDAIREEAQLRARAARGRPTWAERQTYAGRSRP